MGVNRTQLKTPPIVHKLTDRGLLLHIDTIYVWQAACSKNEERSHYKSARHKKLVSGPNHVTLSRSSDPNESQTLFVLLS